MEWSARADDEAASKAHDDVVLFAKSNGFPGATTREEALLTISLRERAMRIVNPQRAHVVTIDLARDRFLEFAAGYKAYEEKSVSSFESFREKREAERARKVAAYERLSDEEKPEALRQLKDEGIRLDGVIAAKTEDTGETADFEVVVDGRLETVTAKRLVIRENDALRPAFTLWVAEALEGRVELLQFYQLGTFSEAVIAELEKVEGLPVRIEAFVDSGTFKKEVFCEIRSIEHEPVPDWAMEIPPGFTKVPDLGKHIEAQQAPEEYLCPHCGKPVGPLEGAVSWRSLGGPIRKYFFDTDACRLDFMRSGAWKAGVTQEQARAKAEGK